MPDGFVYSESKLRVPRISTGRAAMVATKYTAKFEMTGSLREVVVNTVTFHTLDEITAARRTWQQERPKGVGVGVPTITFEGIDTMTEGDRSTFTMNGTIHYSAGGRAQVGEARTTAASLGTAIARKIHSTVSVDLEGIKFTALR
jgi:hypothetical protein